MVKVRLRLMADTTTIGILSDVHYACEAERRRGRTELAAVRNPILRLGTLAFRHFFWQRDPFANNVLLDRALEAVEGCNLVVANGDFSCDTAFVGVGDDAAYASARECLEKMRNAIGDRLRVVLGDHELGKMSLFGGQGGMRLASWERARSDLEIDPFWHLPLGRYVLVGVASSILALPVYENETKPEERSLWSRLREIYLRELAGFFAGLHPAQQVVLFCHDPTALPFLRDIAEVRSRMDQIEMTVIGHLHTPVIYWLGRALAGMPPVDFLGNSVRRMSTALHRADCWSEFKLRLCPSLAGSQMLPDGGVGILELDMEGDLPIRFRVRRVSRK